jgi:general secretion pathway protein N
VFDGPEGRRTMELRVFDGQGGQAPTAIAPPSRRPVEGPILPPRTSTGRPAALTEADDGGKAEGGKPAPVAEADAAPPMTEQSQMEAIRQRIQARRAALREQAQNQQAPRPQPQPPSPPPPNPPPPNPPAESR